MSTTLIDRVKARNLAATVEFLVAATYHEETGDPFRCELDIEGIAPSYEEENSFEEFTDFLKEVWETHQDAYEARYFDILEHGGIPCPEPNAIDVLTPEGKHVFRWYAESMDGEGCLVKGTDHDEFYGVNS